MNIKLLGQGYSQINEKQVGDYILKYLSSKKYTNFLAITAFSSKGGINGISKEVTKAKNSGKNITIITGIDQHGTSSEALKLLRKLNIDSYIFYQTSFSIFHPKIYLFENDIEARLIVGSSNLTIQGLFMNAEASLLLTLNLTKTKDEKLLDDLKIYYSRLFDKTDPNLQPITKSLIKQLVSLKIVPNEGKRKSIHQKQKSKKNQALFKTLQAIFPPRSLSKVHSAFRPSKKTKTKNTKSPNLKRTSVAVVSPKSIAHPSPKLKSGVPSQKLLWESKPLTERDLGIPKGPNTNPTGSMLFKKGVTADIDHRHYFRDNVFVVLKWQQDPPPNQHKERTIGEFELLINGINHGKFNLQISHDTRTNTTTYKQKNSVTQISWGATKNLIGDSNLLGKKLDLYSSNSTQTKFKIVIQ